MNPVLTTSREGAIAARVTADYEHDYEHEHDGNFGTAMLGHDAGTCGPDRDSTLRPS
jgi:hypothetical protein